MKKLLIISMLIAGTFASVGTRFCIKRRNYWNGWLAGNLMLLAEVINSQKSEPIHRLPRLFPEADDR